MQKEYVKPEVARVSLIPEEANLCGCKIGYGGSGSNLYNKCWDWQTHTCFNAGS